LANKDESDSSIKEEASFLASGGDSALASLMALELLQLSGVHDDQQTLITTILNGTFNDISSKLVGKNPFHIQ
jgi:hypothetical protein